MAAVASETGAEAPLLRAQVQDPAQDQARRAVEEALRGISPDLDVEIVPVPAPAPAPQTGSAPATPSSAAGDANPAMEQAEKTPETVDDLFAQLKRTADRRQAQRISERIWALWRQSDSASIDLLTVWAREAMERRDYPVAMDLLDQVVTLRPAYAEGWNQRATLHFMMRDLSKSLADIERTLALEPRHYGALAGLGMVLQQLDRKEDALEAWYRALALYPVMESAQKAVLALEEELAGRGI